MTRRRGGEPSSRREIFFDHFRAAVARLPAGLIRVMPPAPPDVLRAAEVALGRPLPHDYRAFLQSFDGADLFHETILVAGVGAGAPVRLAELPREREGELLFAVAVAGERYAIDERERVIRYDAGAEERAVAGTGFARWLDATVAREQVLYGPDGEYAPEVFDPSGEEVTPLVALRQAERAQKQDPGAAGWAYARGLALRRLGRTRAAVEALDEATGLDPDNPWAWFDLGRAALEDGQRARAVAAFRQAAELDPGPEGGRLLAWAARAAAAGPEVAALREAALARDPALVESLRRAVDAAAADQDSDAQSEAAALLAAIAPDAAVVPRRRLPIVRDLDAGAREPDAPTPPPARPRRPLRAAPPRSGGSRRGS